MIVEEIFSAIYYHMQKGLQFHNQCVSIFNFLNLYGYSEWHKEHYEEESKTCMEVQDFYLNTYSKLIPYMPVESINIYPSNWHKYTKEDVDVNTRRNAIRDFFKQWVDWETETQALYTKVYKELQDLNEIYAMLKIAELLEEVSEELQSAKQKLIELDSSGYDMPFILEDQKNYR